MTLWEEKGLTDGLGESWRGIALVCGGSKSRVEVDICEY